MTLFSGKECSAGQLSPVFGLSVYPCNENGDLEVFHVMGNFAPVV